MNKTTSILSPPIFEYLPANKSIFRLRETHLTSQKLSWGLFKLLAFYSPSVYCPSPHWLDYPVSDHSHWLGILLHTSNHFHDSAVSFHLVGMSHFTLISFSVSGKLLERLSEASLLYTAVILRLITPGERNQPTSNSWSESHSSDF